MLSQLGMQEVGGNASGLAMPATSAEVNMSNLHFHLLFNGESNRKKVRHSGIMRRSLLYLFRKNASISHRKPRNFT